MKMIKEAFLNPSSEFTPIPFWFWNDQLDEAEIIRQIHDFYDKGVHGFVIHPRIGLSEDIEYLSDRFMEYVRCAVEEAEKMGMHVVLYDEGMYPSGSAHGMVVKDNPEYASRGLKMMQYPCTDNLEITPELSKEDKVVSVQAVKKENGWFLRKSLMRLESVNEKIVFKSPDLGEWFVLVFVEAYSRGTIRGIHLGEDDNGPNAPLSADLLNPNAMKKFIALTHDRYYEILKGYFGHTVIAMFTDEPGILGRCHKKGLIPWTQGFLDFYIGCGNNEYDLPSLFLEMDDTTERIRGNYRKAVNKKLEEAYYIPLSRWCAKHGIGLTGHPEKSDEIGFLKHFHIPGQDIVWRWVAPEDGKAIEGEHSTMGKCSSDAARHYGKRRNANECFGCCGPEGIHWAFSVDDMKWYLDWMFVRGVNLIFPHAFYYSVRGKERYGERPPDVGPNNIWWDYYKNISDYIKRMCWLMTDSVNQTKIAVLCEEDHLPWKIVKPLYENQIEFNYLEENLLLSDSCEISDGELLIAKQKYSIVLIENKELVTERMSKRLKPFIEAGGKVVLYDSERSFETRNIKIITQYIDVVESIRSAVKHDIYMEPNNDFLRVSHVIKEGLHFYLLVNEGEDNIEGEISVRQKGKVEIWNAWSGRIERVPVVLKADDSMSIDIKLARRESIILCVDTDKGSLIRDEEEKGGKKVFATEVAGRWIIENQHHEAIEIDHLESWTHWEKFRDFSGILKYKTTFMVKDICSSSKVEIQLGEVHEIAHVYLNGKSIGVKMWSPYTYDITHALVEGENVLEIDVSNSLAIKYQGKDLTSGLIGPVKILSVGY